MKRLALCLVLVIVAVPTARVRHLEGMLDVEWKQKGAQPISLTVYDETDGWPNVVRLQR